MITRLANFAEIKQLNCDICIVGAGPAGLALALELAKHQYDIVLVESGSFDQGRKAQPLSEATIVDPRRHAPMQQATRRQLGGTSAIWGGRCVPFDPIDFEPRPHVPDSGWPLAYDEIAQYYVQACEYAGCGTADFSTATALPGQRTSIVPGLPDDDVRSSALERWGSPTNLGSKYRARLERTKNVRVLLDGTCTFIDFDRGPARVTSLKIAAVNGPQLTLHAKVFVLACGGLESTRLLLHSDRHHPGGVGNHSGKLGRFYMGHVSGKIAEAHFCTPPEQTIFGFERDRAGVYCRKRFTLSAELQRQHSLLNCAFWLDNPKLNDEAHRNGILSFAYLALSTPVLSRYLAPEAIRNQAVGSKRVGTIRAHLDNILSDLPAVVRFAPVFAYRRYVAERRLPGFFLYNKSNIYALHYHAEHAPNSESNVRLSDTADALGIRRLIIDIKFNRIDAESIVRGHHLLDQHLRQHQCGKLVYNTQNKEETVLAQAGDGFHQVGTTRMSANENNGVVDTQCRVHGTDNLYVCSSSIFPTSGQANPTLTILALSVRLARHLHEQRLTPLQS